MIHLEVYVTQKDLSDLVKASGVRSKGQLMGPCVPSYSVNLIASQQRKNNKLAFFVSFPRGV